jgi:mannose-6-phosphate isomerase-like protein (cupin superfamily)
MSEKNTQFQSIENQLQEQGFTIIDQDFERPWGGFFVIDEDQSKQFVERYFSEKEMDEINISGRLSPKILLVEPGKRLSWQYHHRRSELWKVVEGPVGIIRSLTDQQKEVKPYKAGDVVTLQQGERHRLVGLEDWGIVAEIWQHIYADHPSDEKDIVRIADDFGR